jgi:hypothetical protein
MDCYLERRRIYREKNKERDKQRRKTKDEHDKLYRIENNKEKSEEEKLIDSENEKERSRLWNLEYRKANNENYKLKTEEEEFLYNEQRKEKSRIYSILYRELNKEKVKQTKKNWKDNNKEYVKEKTKEYYENNKDILKEKGAKHRKKYLQNNPKSKFKERLRTRILKGMKTYSKSGKTKTCAEYGIDFEAIYNKIGPKPDDTYHLDHIIPMSVFDFDISEHVKLCNSPENLRWVPSKENLEKWCSICVELIEADEKLIYICEVIGLDINKYKKGNNND